MLALQDVEDLPERNFALPLVSQLEQSSTVPTILVRKFELPVFFAIL